MNPKGKMQRSRASFRHYLWEAAVVLGSSAPIARITPSRSLCALIAVIGTLSCLQSSSYCDEPSLLTPRDVIAGYEMNRAALKSPRIVWSTTTRDLMKNEPPATQVMDFWTDSMNIHLRWRWVFQDGYHEAYRLPNTSLSSDNLLTSYVGMTVASYLPGESPRMRRLAIGRRRGEVALDGAVGDEPMAIRRPPLTVSKDIKRNHWNAIDLFFAESVDRMQVVKTPSEGDNSTVVLEHVVVTPYPDDFTSATGVFERASVARAWIDMAQGFLPLRIDWGTRVLRDKAILMDTMDEPSRRLEVTRIERLPGGCYYPMEGHHTTFGPDPKHANRFLTMDEWLQGKRLDIPRTRIESAVTQWQVQSVDPVFAMNDADLRFEFPRGTRYFDQLAGRLRIVGLTDAEVDSLRSDDDPAAPLSPPRAYSRSRWLQALLALALLAAMTVFAFALLTRQSRKGRV